MSVIADNITLVQQKIKKAQATKNVTLIAVSKKQPIDRIHAALDAGQRVFGENRVQEAGQRWDLIKPDYPDLELHLIGPLQTNKVKEAVHLFDVIQSLDRPKLARALAKEMNKQNRFLPCFIQVNTGEEPQKSGVIPSELMDLVALCQEERLNITGLMCIPPAQDPPALHFALLRQLAEKYQFEKLSMGMSGDFEKAIPLGATHIRVGTSIFGSRQS